MNKKFRILLSLVVFFTTTVSASTTWTIQGEKYQVDTISHFYTGPGTTQTQLKLTTNGKTQKLYYTTTDLTNPYVTVKVGTAGDGIWGKDGTEVNPCGDEVLSKMITHRKEFISGVNADFFGNFNDRRHPEIVYRFPMYGHIVCDGEPYYMRPSMSENAICITDNNEVLYGQANYTATVTIKDGNGKLKKETKLTSINKDREAENLVLYTHRLNTYNHGTRTNEWGREAYLKMISGNLSLGKKSVLSVEKLSIGSGKTNKEDPELDEGNMFINDDKHYALSGHGSSEKLINSLTAQSSNIKGDIIEITPQLTINGQTRNDVVQITAGMPMILKNGEILNTETALDHLKNSEPRTSVGSSQNILVMLVVDGRGQAGSTGVTSKQLADIMKHLGCTEALNFDGGGSSEMYNRNYGVINHPSDGKEREVINGLFVATKDTAYMDNNTIATIQFKDYKKDINNKETYTPVILGYNKYGVLINTDVPNVTLSCDSELGTTNKNTLTGSGINGTHLLTAKYGTASTSIPVTISGGANTPTPEQPTPSVNEPMAFLSQISEIPISSWNGNNGTQATVAGGKLWLYNPTKKTINWYQYNGKPETGLGREDAGAEGAEAFTFDEANHLIIRTATYFDIWEFNYKTGDRNWVAKIAVSNATSGKYIAAVGDILNGGYIVVPGDNKILKVSKGEVVGTGKKEYKANIDSYYVPHVADSEENKSYIYHIGNGRFLINAEQTDYFVFDINKNTINKIAHNSLGMAFSGTANKAGKIRMNTIGGSYVNLSGEDLYFYNTYQNNDKETARSLRFTGCATNGRKIVNGEPQKGYFFNPTLLNETSFAKDPDINFILPQKIDENNCLIYQYSPTDNVVRCFKVELFKRENILPQSAKTTVEQEMVLAKQTKAFNQVFSDVEYTYDVISDININATLKNVSSVNKHLQVQATSTISSKETTIQEKEFENNTVSFNNLKINTPYKMTNTVNYKWYNAETGVNPEFSHEIQLNYVPQPVNNTHGCVTWAKETSKDGQTTTARAYIFIGFTTPTNTLDLPVSEYKVYMKDIHTAKDNLITTIRGNITNSGEERWTLEGTRYMGCACIDNINSRSAAEDIVTNNVFYVETVYADANSNIRQVAKSEEFGVNSKISHVDDIEINQNIHVYPTMAKDLINIVNDDIINNVKIYTMFGTCVKEVNNIGQNHMEISVGNLNAGHYIIKVNDNAVVKFVKL